MAPDGEEMTRIKVR